MDAYGQVHDEFLDLARKVFQQTGVKINHVAFDWEENKSNLRSVTVHSIIEVTGNKRPKS